jgi:hypothetical protein
VFTSIRWCEQYPSEPTSKCDLFRLTAGVSAVSFLDSITPTRDSVPNFLTNAVDLGIDVYTSLPTKAAEIFKSGGGGDFGGAGASGTWDTISDHVSGAASTVQELAASGLTVAGEASQAGLNAVVSIGSAVGDAASSVGSALGSVAEGAGDMASGLGDIVSSIDL